MDSIVRNNASTYLDTGLGGGIEISAGARAILNRSQVAGNENGGISNDGELFLVESSITDNNGGLPALFNGAAATAVIERSLIANNTRGGRTVSGDAALDNRGSMNVINSTISGNEGSGLINSGPLNLTFSTIAFNDDYGFLSSESSTDSPWLTSLVIAGNNIDCYVPGAPSSPGVYTLSGYNVDTDGSCGFSVTFPLADLELDLLADNGGPTLTHALQPGSPAIDVTSDDCPPQDQRIVARPFGPACDAGAYESGGTALSLDLDLDTATSTPEFPTLIVTTDSGCFAGPGLDWPRFSNLSTGTQAQIVGQGWGGGWMVIKHPTIKNTNCWIDQDDVDFDIPLDQLRLISIPPKPTKSLSPTNEPRETPVPTVCYFNQQTQQLICQ